MINKWLLSNFILLSVFVSLSNAEEKKPQTKSELPKAVSLFDGKNLKPWKVLVKDIFEEHGKVSVANGEIHLGKGDPSTGIVYTKEVPKINYEINLEAKRVEGGDFFCGLTMPVNDSHCTLILGGWGGGVVGISNVDNFAAVENETTDYIEFENNRWYKIRVRVTSKMIQVWVDKDDLIELEIEDRKFNVWWEQEHARPLGIVNWNTGSALRNLTLTDLNKKK